MLKWGKLPHMSLIDSLPPEKRPMGYVSFDSLKNPNVQPFKGDVLLHHERTKEDELVGDRMWLRTRTGIA